MEQKLKQLIADLVFNNIALQHQIEELNEKIKQYETELRESASTSS